MITGNISKKENFPEKETLILNDWKLLGFFFLTPVVDDCVFGLLLTLYHIRLWSSPGQNEWNKNRLLIGNHHHLPTYFSFLSFIFFGPKKQQPHLTFLEQQKYEYSVIVFDGNWYLWITVRLAKHYSEFWFWPDKFVC